MLLALKVSHFAIIDSLEVNFLRPGLNVLTGETGAGKSILLKSLALLLGGKASPEVIRSGQEQAVIEGAFDLSFRPEIRNELKDLALDSGEDTLVIRRIINLNGKHRVYINGYLSTLNILEKLVPRLVEITSQNEHHSLIRSASQLAILDEFAKNKGAKQKYIENYEEVQKLKKQIEELSSADRDREQRLDFLKFQINEIETFNPTIADQEITARAQKAKSSVKLLHFAKKAEDALYNDDRSVHSILKDLVQEGEPLLSIDPQLKDGVQSLKEASILVAEASYNFRDYSKNDSLDPTELDQLEERLSDLKKLQKKYGATIDDLLNFKEKALSEFHALEKHDENLKNLQEKLKVAEILLLEQALDLHTKRTKAAVKLASGINQEIHDLNMKGTEFSITISKLETPGANGISDVQFLIKSSPKDLPKPISKIASGGELSRLMLALKQVVAAGDLHATYLFDEVDTGVSGPTAEKVGRKLKKIGSYHQVICITHLPQVAAFADAHFLITKDVVKGQVKSQVTELNAKERVQELGRLISGEKITASGLAHAKAMIKEFKRPDDSA